VLGPIALAAKGVIAGVDREPHEPVLERRRALVAAEFLEGLGENRLHNILGVRLVAKVFSRHAKHPRLVAGDQFLEAVHIAADHGLDQLLVGSNISFRESFGCLHWTLRGDPA